MKHFKFLFALGTLAALAGCSAATKKIQEADQKQIFQQYELAFNTTDNKTTAEAQFREGSQSGTTLALVLPSKVELSSMELKADEKLGTKYVGEKSGLVKEHQFTFTDADGKQWTNKFSIPEAKLPNALVAKHAGDKALPIAWEGEPLADDQDVVTLLVARKGAAGIVPAAERFAVAKGGAKGVEISLDKVKAFAGTSRTLHLERKRTVKLQAGTNAGGFAVITYVSAPVDVEFVGEAPKADAPKAVPPKSDAPKADVPKVDEVKQKADEAAKKAEAEAKKKADEAAKKVEGAGKKVDEAAKKAADEAQKKADELKKKVKDLGDKADDAAKKAADEAQKLADELKKKLEEPKKP